MFKKIMIFTLLILLTTRLSYSQLVKIEKVQKEIEILKIQIENEKRRMEPLIQILEQSEKHAKKLMLYNKNLTELEALRYGFYVEKYSRIRNVDPDLVVAIIIIESHVNSKAVSCVQAVGLMQIHYRVWYSEIKKTKQELFDPETNIEYGTYILRYYLDKYDDDMMDAIVAYNTGSRKKINPDYTTKVCNMYFNIKNGD